MSKENKWTSNKNKSDWFTSATPLPDWAKSTPTSDLSRTAIIPGDVFKKALDELSSKVNKAVQPGQYDVKDQDDYLQSIRQVLIDVGNALQQWKGGVGATASMSTSHDPKANGWLHTPWISTAADEDEKKEDEKKKAAPEMTVSTKSDAIKMIVDSIANTVKDNAVGGSASIDSVSGKRSVTSHWLEGVLSKYVPIHIDMVDLRDPARKALTAAGVSIGAGEESADKSVEKTTDDKTEDEEERTETVEKDPGAKKVEPGDEGEGDAGFRDPKPKHKSIAPSKKMPGVKKPRPPKLRFIQ